MKRILLLLTFFSLIGGELLAQAPQGFQYQAVARTDSGQLIANATISVRISIQEGSGGSVVGFYIEDHNDIKTNNYGLFSLVIGEGLKDGSNDFEEIDWGSTADPMKDPWYIKVEVDQNGGTDDNFTKIGDPVQLRSVPYALFALETAESPTLSLDALTDVNTTGVSVNQVLKYDGTNWIPANDNVAIGGGGVNTTPRLSGQGSIADPLDIAAQGASNGQVLRFNGSSWAPANDAIDDADADPANEFQDLSINGSVISLSNSSATVTLPDFPAGTIIMFGGSSANVPSGWLICDGSSYIKTAYPALSNAIGVSWGGTSSTFNVPDMRGRFVRGYDDGQGRDPDAATRTASNAGGNTGDAVGSLQPDAFQGHWHRVDFFDSFGTPLGIRPLTGPTDREIGPNAAVNQPTLAVAERQNRFDVLVQA